MKKKKVIQINEGEYLSDLISEEKAEIVKMTDNSFMGVIVLTGLFIIATIFMPITAVMRVFIQIFILVVFIALLFALKNFKKLQLDMVNRYNKMKLDRYREEEN